jgi:hypothetical protein
MSSLPRPLRLRHVNGSVGTAHEKIKVKRGLGQFLKLSNTSANTLQVSFNNGRDWYTIGPTDPPLELTVLYHFFLVKADVAASTYEALLGEG